MAALVRQDAVLKPVLSDAGAELGADATEIARLYRDPRSGEQAGEPAHGTSARLRQQENGTKLTEEAGEIALEAVRHRSRGVVRGNADLIYYLVVLWSECGIAPDEVWCEMRRRANSWALPRNAETTGRYAPAPACDK
jgi:phosphoribosyl-ATP pyrophosphohydrolase